MDIALAESLNAVWKHAKIHRDLKIEDVKSTVQDLTTIYDRIKILSARELSEEAIEIALTQNIAIYDSLYIAAARKLKATIYTADRKLHTASSKLADAKLLRIE